MPPKKSLRLSTKPSAQTPPSEAAADAWVEDHQSAAKPVVSPEPQKTKRITFEVSEDQHLAIKIHAARKGLTIKELMQSLLQQELSTTQPSE